MHEINDHSPLAGETWSVLALSALWRAVALPHLVYDVRAVCGLWPAL